MARGALITKEKFSDIKLLLTNGLSINKAASIANVSIATVRRVDKHASFEDFKGIKPKEPPKETPKTAIISYDQFGELVKSMNVCTNVLNNILSLLTKYMEV